MQVIMGAVLPEIQRWQEITILADNWAPLHAFLHYVQNMFPPLLRKLSLQRHNPYFAGPSQKFAPATSRVFVPLFGNVALEELRTVELQGIHVDWGKVKSTAGSHQPVVWVSCKRRPTLFSRIQRSTALVP